MSQLPGLNPAGTFYIGNNSSLSIGNDNKLIINNGDVYINKSKVLPLSKPDNNEYVYLVTDTIVSVTPNTVVTVSNDIFTLVEGGTYEFVISKELVISLETVNADEIFDNNIGNFTSVIGYSLPQSTSSRFFIYAKLNSAVKLKILQLDLQPALTIKIKRVGPFHKNSLKLNTDVSQIMAGACSAIFQAITIQRYQFMAHFPRYPVDFIEYVKQTNKYERYLLNRIILKTVKIKKLTADSTWDSLKTYIDPSGGSALTFMEGQSWTLSVEDVFNNIPLTLRVLNETPQNLKNNKIVVSQYLIEFPNTITTTITSIHIETAIIPVGYHPSIVSVDKIILENMFPVLRQSPSYVDNTITKLEQYNAEMEAVNYTQLLNLEPSERITEAIKILEDTCYENGILQNSTIKFVEAFNVHITKSTSNDIAIPDAGDIYFSLPLIDVTEFLISNNGTKILGVPRIIGDFPYIIGTTPISGQDFNGTYIPKSDLPFAWQCKSRLSINGDMISTTITDEIEEYTIAGTSQDITGSIPYWVAPGGSANIDLLEYYVRVLQNQSPHLMYKITIAENIVVRRVLGIPPINRSPSGQPLNEIHRKIQAVYGMKPNLYNLTNIFTLLYTTNPLLKTLTRILKTIICVCGPAPVDLTNRITNNDTSVYTDLPALYYILKLQITLKDFIWGRLVDDFAITPFPVYNFDLIINLKLLADDLKMTNVFTQKLPEVTLTQGPVVELIQNESNELLTDLPMLISILKSNDTLNFILTAWNTYYASFENNTKDAYTYRLVNALRSCYKNWKDNFPTALSDPLTRFANIVPYTGFSYFRTGLNNAILQADDPSIDDYSRDLDAIYSIWIPAIVNISGLNAAGTTAQTVINNIYTKLYTKTNKLELNLIHLTKFNNITNYLELVISNITPLLTPEELTILNTIDTDYADARLNMLLFGQKVQKPYDIIINTINKLYNIFIFMTKIERLLFEVGRPFDTNLPVINNILTIQSLIDNNLEFVIKYLQKIVDIRSLGNPKTITL
jgi:hypothetical protein